MSGIQERDHEVTNLPADLLPEARLSNAIAKRKAKLLRERINELF